MNEGQNEAYLPMNLPHFSNGVMINGDIRPKTLTFALLKDEPDPTKKLVVLDRAKDFDPNIHEKYVAPERPVAPELEQPTPVVVSSKPKRSRSKVSEPAPEVVEEVETVEEPNAESNEEAQ